MNKNIVKTAILTLLASAIIAAPTVSRAQETSTNSSATNAPVKPKKHESLVFRGTASAVDTNAMTLTIEKRTFVITSETKITKNGEPATLSDIAVGDKVGGAYKKSEDGKLNATTINDGKKAAGEKKKSDEPAK